MHKLLTLKEVKLYLKITSDDYDKIIPNLIDDVSNQIRNFCAKEFITQQFTEYHNGDSKSLINTVHYPVYSVTSLHDDPDHAYGAGELVTTTDFRIYYDWGKIELTGSETTFYNGIQNVKVVYSAGYSRFLVLDESNNYIDIEESGQPEVAIEIAEATLPDDTIYKGYTAEDLATTIQTALNAHASLADGYSVLYNHETQKFTFSTSTSTDFQINWKNGASKSKSLAELMGFDDADTDTTNPHESDDGVSGIPSDLRLAAIKLLSFSLEQTGEGKIGAVNVSRVAKPQGQGTTDYVQDMPKDVERILKKYRRLYA